MTDAVTLVANTSLALSFIVGLLVGVFHVRAWARDRKERLTLETLRFYQSREFAELSDFIIRGNFPKTRKEFDAMPREERILFIDFSQKMESLGLLVSDANSGVDSLPVSLSSRET